MTVDYEEGRRLLKALGDAEDAWETATEGGMRHGSPERHVCENAEARLAEWMTTHAEALLNPDPWRPIEELPEELHGKKIIVCWEASGGWDDHWEIGVKKQRGWVNNYGHPFTGEPTHFRELKGPGHG